MAKQMTDAEKLMQLKEKYNQLKQNNKILKEGLLEKQESCGRLEQQVKDKDATLRQQLEEIDHLQYQSSRTAKQLSTVTQQLEEQRQRQTTQSGWSVGGLISGKQQQEAVQKAEEEIRVLQSELMMKIQENEELHMQLFEARKQHDDEAHKLREAGSRAETGLATMSEELNAERQRSSRLFQESEGQGVEIQRLSDELVATSALADSLRCTLEVERSEARNREAALLAEIRRWAHFDDGRHSAWTALSSSSQQGRLLHRRLESSQHLQSTLVDVCGQSSKVLQSWAKTFGGGGDGESGARLRMRNKLSSSAEALAKLVDELLPGLLIGAVDFVNFVPPKSWIGNFSAGARNFMRVHRKWVIHQSLILLHDSNGTAVRPAQEDALAHRFADWLWRLHRCLRALLSRLRLLSVVQAMTTSSSSATHFEVASNALRRNLACAQAVGIAGSSSPANIRRRAAGVEVARSVVLGIRSSLQDVVQCWEGIGRCLSTWASVQATPAGSDSGPQDRKIAVELIELVHRFSSYLADHALPAISHAIFCLPRCAGGRVVVSSLSPLPPSSLAIGRSVPAAPPYAASSIQRLARAPGAIGFREALQTRHTAQRLSGIGERLSTELRQQVQRLQVATDEKGKLSEELRAVQDDNALLRSNFQVLQEQAAAIPAPSGSTGPPPTALHAVAAAVTSSQASSRADRGDLVLSSRQRALLESLSVTAQESASLRQHGYFVEVISLAPSDIALAAGGPQGDGSAGAADAPDAASWEAAVRRVYEQQVRGLQAQVRSADAKAMHLHLRAEKHLDSLRGEESAKQRIWDEAEATRTKLKHLQDDMTATQRNYDAQLAILTEHICTLSTKLSDKDESIAAMQTNKILCGRCGSWNAVGRLLSKDIGGTCQTCKEKVLSHS